MTEDFYAGEVDLRASYGQTRARAGERTRLRRRNRVILAKRLHWPKGALAACDELERKHRGLIVSWMPENRRATPGFDRDEGYYAWREGDDPQHNHVRRKEWYGATPEELAAVLAARKAEGRDLS